MIRSKDGKGSYYRGINGVKHYYKTGNTASRNRAKVKALGGVKTVKGAGLLDVINPFTLPSRIMNFFKGPRQSMPPQIREFLNREGDVPIINIAVCRTPIQSGIKAVLDTLSLGGFSRTQKRLGYDDVYHNYLVVQLANQRAYKIEKNQIVQISPASKADLSNASDVVNIPINPMGRLDQSYRETGPLTLRQIFNNAEQKYGPARLYLYNPSLQNCQLYVSDMLEASNLLNGLSPDAMEIINPQDAGKLIASLGRFSSLPKAITDLAGSADRLIHGGKLKKKGRGLSVEQFFSLVNKA